jgi:hypothetical protein
MDVAAPALLPPPAPPDPDDEDLLPRSSLKLYNAALDDDAGIDLSTWPAAANRLQNYHDLVERERTMERYRPATVLPPPAPVRIDRPSQIGTVSPRTRHLSAELRRRQELRESGRASENMNNYPVRVKASIMASIEAQMPPSPRKSKAVAEQMAAEKRAAIAAKMQAKADAKAAHEAAVAAGEVPPSPDKKESWQEGRHERERRMRALMDDGIRAADAGASALRGQLNAFRELTKEKVTELALLKAELEVLEREHGKNGGDARELKTRRVELEEQLSLADWDSVREEDATLTYAFMQERLRVKRPHLERKLAFLRSQQVELAVRLQEQLEANKVAVDYAARMDQRIADARKALNEQVASHQEQRAGMKDQLFQMGSAKRRALGSDTRSMTDQQLEKLNSMIAADHAEMQSTIDAQNAHADQKADAAYAAAAGEIDAKSNPLKLSKAMVSNVEAASLGAPATAMAEGGGGSGGVRDAGPAKPGVAARKMGKREAWQRLCILTGEDTVKGVLEYWEEKMETKEALQHTEQERLEELSKQKRTLVSMKVSCYTKQTKHRLSAAGSVPCMHGMPSFPRAPRPSTQRWRLTPPWLCPCSVLLNPPACVSAASQNQFLDARDRGDTQRAAMDAEIDRLEAKNDDAMGEAKRWMRRVERIEQLVSAGLSSMLSRTVGMLTHRAIVERATPTHRAMLTRYTKQVDEVTHALHWLQQKALQASQQATEDGQAAADEAENEAARRTRGSRESRESLPGEQAPGQPPQEKPERPTPQQDKHAGGGPGGNEADGSGGVGGVSAAGLSMAVAHLISQDSESNSTGTVNADELRAVQATLLCTTSQNAVLALMDMMQISPADQTLRQPEFAPQLLGDLATRLNVRTPRNLPSRELTRAAQYSKQLGFDPPLSPTQQRQRQQTEERESQRQQNEDKRRKRAAAAPAPAPAAADVDDDVLAIVASDIGSFSFSAIDPITLAGTSEIEAEMVAEIAAGTLQFGLPAWQLKEEADHERDEVKHKALKFLTEKLGKDDERVKRYKQVLDLAAKHRKPKPTAGLDAAKVRPGARGLFSDGPGQSLDADAVAANKAAREAQQQQQQQQQRAMHADGADDRSEGELASLQAKAAQHVGQTRSVLGKPQLGDMSRLRPAPPKGPASQQRGASAARARGMASARGANSARPARGAQGSSGSASARPQTAPRPSPMKSTPSGVMRR